MAYVLLSFMKAKEKKYMAIHEKKAVRLGNGFIEFHHDDELNVLSGTVFIPEVSLPLFKEDITFNNGENLDKKIDELYQKAKNRLENKYSTCIKN